MNFKLAAFIVVDVVIIVLLLVQLQYTVYIPQGYSRLRQMRMSILQSLNYAMSASDKTVQESQKKLLRFKVKEAAMLNDRIAKYIAKKPSTKDKMEHQVRDFHHRMWQQPQSQSWWIHAIFMTMLNWSDEFNLIWHFLVGCTSSEEFYSSCLQQDQQIGVHVYDKYTFK